MKTIQIVILQALEGCKLVNRTAKTIAVQVQLAPNATPDDWIEVTDEEAEALQAEWAREAMPQDERTDEA